MTTIQPSHPLEPEASATQSVAPSTTQGVQMKSQASSLAGEILTPQPKASAPWWSKAKAAASRVWGKLKPSTAQPDSSQASKEAQKTEKVRTSHFPKPEKAEGGIWATIKTDLGEQGLTIAENIATMGFHPDTDDQERITELKKLTQSEDLVSLITLLSAQLNDQMQNKFAKSDESDFKKGIVRNNKQALQQIIHSALLNVALELAKSAKEQKEGCITTADILGRLMQMVKESCPDFDKNLAELEKIPNEDEKNEKLQKYLQPFVDKLVKMAFPNGSKDMTGLGLLKGAFYSKIKDSILPEMAAMLVKEYRKQRATYQEAKDSLQKAISEKMGSPESDPEVARIFSLIENGTGFAAKQLRQKLQESLQGDTLNLTTEFIGEDKQKNRQLDAANRLLKGLASAKSELPHDITDLLDEQIEALLMKMMANLLQNPEFSKESLTKGAGVSDLIIRFLGAMTDKLAQLKEQETDGDDLNAFVPLAQELLKMANPTLPSLFGMNKRLWKQMENRVLPGFLAKMYKETSSWVRRKEKNQKKLQELFGTTHAQEACRVLSHYVADFLPWYLSTSNDQIAEMAFTLMSNQTKKADDPQSQAFLQEIKKNKQVIMDFVSHHAQKLGDSNSDEAKKVWGLAKEYGEAALLEMFVRMAKRVHSLESTKGKNYRPEFAMHTAFQLLEKLREHFGKTNEIKDNQGVKHAHQVDPETMYAEFGETLHSGIPAASDLPEEEKQRTRLDDFSGFIDKIQNILQLSGNTQALGKQIFPNLLLRLMNHLNEDYTKDSMLLGVLQMINEALQEPPKDDPKLSRHHEEEKKKDFSGALSSIVSNELANLDTESKTKATLTITDWLMHLEDKESTLTLEEHLEELGCQLEDIVPEQNLREKRKNLSKPLCEFTLYWNELQKNNSLSFQKKQTLLKKKREALIQTSTEEMTRPLEALQILLQERKFDAECGEMVRELINMLPFTMTKTIFNDFDILKEKSAETVGRLVRSYFDRTSMLEIIDKGIVRILPYLHPGEWKGEEGQETFEPQGGKYKFDLPKTPEEKAALKAKRKRQAKRKRREFAKTAAETLSSQLANGLTKFIKSLWDSFTKAFDSTFPSAKKFFDRVFNHGISQLIMSGFKMLFKTLLEIGRSLFEEIYLKRKMRKVTKTAHMPHHENLFYQWRDVLVDALDVTSEQPAKA